MVDNGACWCRAGFAGEEVPSSTIRSLIGRYIDDVSTTINNKTNRVVWKISNVIIGDVLVRLSYVWYKRTIFRNLKNVVYLSTSFLTEPAEL